MAERGIIKWSHCILWVVSGFTESGVQNYKELTDTLAHHSSFTDAKTGPGRIHPAVSIKVGLEANTFDAQIKILSTWSSVFVITPYRTRVGHHIWCTSNIKTLQHLFWWLKGCFGSCYLLSCAGLKLGTILCTIRFTMKNKSSKIILQMLLFLIIGPQSKRDHLLCASA